MPRPLYVTRPLLPDISDVELMLRDIWRTGNVTNVGPFHEQLEAALKNELGVPTVSLFNNGTNALLIALKLFNLQPGSEVITTPLTFAATAHAIAWNGLRPVFVDVSPDTLTIDPAAVEKAITPLTRAILGVHVYGTVCDVNVLKQIADHYDLKLIYDAAHAFGTTINGRSIASFGDASAFSFHATKLFTTLEGGALATPRSSDHDTIYLLRNFGIKNEEDVVSIGINGKMNEVQAAIGILNLSKVSGEREARARLRTKLDEALSGLPGISLQPVQPGVQQSEQYYPIVIDSVKFGRNRDEMYNLLKERGIFSRKYFHPICTDFVPYRGYPIVSTRNMPYVLQVKSQVLCLPFFSGVSDEDVAEVRAVFSQS